MDGPGVITGRYGTLGEVYYVDGPCWPLNTTLFVRDFHGNDPRFCFYFLQHQGLGSQDGAAAVPGVNRNVLHDLPVVVPPVDVQRKIATVLSAYDDLIDNNRRRIKLLEEMAQRIYREWFVDFRHPGHDTVPLVESELGPIPERWAVMTASEAMDIDPRVALPKDVPIPFVPMASVSESTSHISAVEMRANPGGARFNNGDTLFARITPCLENGKTAYVQFLARGQGAAGSTEFIVLRSRHLTPTFVYLLARSDLFRDHAVKSMSGATGRQRVRREAFDSYLLAVPPPDLLAKFTEIVEPLLRASVVLFTQNGKLTEARDLLLPRLISGDIDVQDIDISVEAAA